MSETSNKTGPQGPAKPRRKWPKVLLAVSLTLNLLVIGLVVGAKAGGHHGRSFDPRGPERDVIGRLGFAPLAGAFTPRDRRAIGKEMKARSGSYRDHGKLLEQEFSAMLEELRADPFDADRFALLMQSQADRMHSRAQTLRGLVIDRISLMSLAERRDFADRIARKVKRGRHSD
ncbi:periplasmic heavy metal sensor [Aliiroseovarius marinus]|uniref:periplasmic heavy metal sensor n=1 Tax=Aliiroseovarius marinus TaxID=2500159 RepID=UPI003D7EB27F